jgi:aspartate carbamoyltransferase regulatory subunit
MCVSKFQSKKSNTNFNNIINKYTKLDPTLPRINNILCPNSECSTNTKNEEKEIIYIRYDETNMKYVYLCSTCDTVWEVNEV